MNNEAARIKQRKYNEAFNENVDSIVDAFNRLRDICYDEVKSIN
jgi:hypothetical protein